MKRQSIQKYAASAFLLPLAGFAVIQSAAQFSPAFADTHVNPVLAQANSAQTPAQGKRGERGEKMFQQLGLSSSQQAQITSIRNQSKTSSAGLRQQLKTAHQQLQSLLASSTDESAIRQAHQQLQSLEQQMHGQRFDTMLKVREVLTPAQRTKLAELHKQGGRGNHYRQAPPASGTAS